MTSQIIGDKLCSEHEYSIEYELLVYSTFLPTPFDKRELWCMGDGKMHLLKTLPI